MEEGKKSIIELQKENFNLKMQNHEYEIRLKELGLSGMDGDRLYKRNKDLELEKKKLLLELQQTKQKLKEVTEVCVKTRPVLEEYGSKLLKAEAELETIKNQKEIEARKNSLLTQEMEILKTQNENFKVNMVRFDKYKKELTECNMLIEKLQHSLQVKDTEIEAREKDYKKKLSLEITKTEIKEQSRTEVTKQELMQSRAELKILRDQAETSKLDRQKLNIELKEVRKQNQELSFTVADISSKLNAAEDKLSFQLEQLKQTHEHEFEMLETEYKNNLNKIQKSSTSNLFSLRNEVKESENKFYETQTRHQIEVEQLKRKNKELQAEVESVREKWYNSITKKSKPRTTREGRPTRSSSANPLRRSLPKPKTEDVFFNERANSSRNEPDENVDINCFQSEKSTKSSFISGSTKERSRPRLRKNGFQVQSRYMQPSRRERRSREPVWR
eukprot:augustus_masked-scaffold_3-processed-gene-4.46-mRNA-1 protein AED:1.00 eAED:1.00 QI:0/-1/0/0/-1/1/1/0/444